MFCPAPRSGGALKRGFCPEMQRVGTFSACPRSGALFLGGLWAEMQREGVLCLDRRNKGCRTGARCIRTPLSTAANTMDHSRLAKKPRLGDKDGPQNCFFDAVVFSPEETAKACELVRTGFADAVIIDLGVDSICFDGEEMVRYFNARVKEEFRVPVPESPEDLNLKTYGSLPGIRGGMMHTYASSAHDRVADTAVIRHLFEEMTGTKDWKLSPQRFRYNGCNDDGGYQSAHIEGEHVMKNTTDLQCIVAATAGRTFTYYRGSNNDDRMRELFVGGGGEQSKFVKLSPHQLRHWQRTTITTTKPGQVIVFAGSVAHEVSRWGESLSLFMSPYDPAKEVKPEEYYSGCATIAEAKKLQVGGGGPLPTRFMNPGHQRQMPSQYRDMSVDDTRVFGSLFGIGGAYWPSGKAAFFMMHMMAFNAYKDKLMPFMFDANGKFNYEVITPDLVRGIDGFDDAYFKKLPLADVTEEEVAAMRRKYSLIPEQAWPLVRYWTKDPRRCSDFVAQRRGYMPMH